jgi:hypothetical protein
MQDAKYQDGHAEQDWNRGKQAAQNVRCHGCSIGAR